MILRRSGRNCLPIRIWTEIDGDVGSASFTVTRDGVYRIFATDLAGLESQEPLDYFIRAIEDAPGTLLAASGARSGSDAARGSGAGSGCQR